MGIKSIKSSHIVYIVSAQFPVQLVLPGKKVIKGIKVLEPVTRRIFT